MPLTIRRIDSICLAILVIAAVSCGSVAAKHIMRHQRRVRQEMALLSAKINEKNLVENNLHQIRKVFEVYSSQLRYFNERIPKSGLFGDFLKQLHSLLQQKSLTLLSLNPMSSAEKNGYRKIPVQITIQGTFANIYGFILDLERLNRLVIMEKMSISKTGKDDLCRANLAASVFERGPR